MPHDAATTSRDEFAAADLPAWDRFTRWVLPLTLGVAMTLALAGYRFGESNHAVYLLDALRHNDPGVLANDWWTRSTLQYHFVFNRLSAFLMRTGTIEPAFLAGYVGLAVLLHVAWRRLTLLLGGDDGVYLASAVLYHLMAAGTGLGVYHFLQNSAFLPSNVSNVAMLWGVYLWIRGRPGWAGLAFGLAGLFHLNHALAGIGLWVGMTGLAIRRARGRVALPRARWGARRRGGTLTVRNPPDGPSPQPSPPGTGERESARRPTRGGAGWWARFCCWGCRRRRSCRR